MSSSSNSSSHRIPRTRTISARGLDADDKLIYKALPADIMETIYKMLEAKDIRNFCLTCRGTMNLPFSNEIYKFKLVWPMLVKQDEERVKEIEVYNEQFLNLDERDNVLRQIIERDLKHLEEGICLNFFKPTEGDKYGCYNIFWTIHNVWNSKLFQAYMSFFFDLALDNDISLSKSVGSFKSFTWLDCRMLGLTSLPERLGNLKSLKELYCSFNQLTSLPESLGQLTDLKKLYCHTNQLTSLPESLANLTSLRDIYCYNDPDLVIPDALVNNEELRILR